MTTTLIVGVLVAGAALLIVRPLVAGGRRPRAGRPAASGAEPDRELLRQLRDLDEDLAAGKLAEVEHARLRAPVEAQAAATLTASRTRGRTATARPTSTTNGSPRTARPARRYLMALLLGAVVTTAVVLLLTQSLSARAPGQTVSGDGAGVGTAGAAAEDAAGGQDPASAGADKQMTAEQVAAVEASVTRVRQHPKDPAAHVDLARAYAAAGQAQLSTIEYLAVLRLDDTNAEANTALAMVAFVARQPQEAKKLVDKALAAHPGYPEALYTRGLVNLMGLKHPGPAERDLRAYLDSAPFGSHRATVATLLAMIPDQGAP